MYYYILLLLVYFIAITIDYILYREIISSFTIIISPYVFIILFNNLFASRFGFYSVENKSIFLLTIAFSLFYLGAVISRIFLRPQRNHDAFMNIRNVLLSKQLNAKLARKLLFYIIILRLVSSVVKIVSMGLPEVLDNDFEDLSFGGVIGHSFLIGYILLAIIYIDYLYGKRVNTRPQIVMISLMFGIAAFSSFVKYHVIIIPLMFFFILLFGYKSIKILKLVIILVLSILLLFIFNYWLSFYLRGVSSNTSFYLRHLWAYLSGGIINTNHIDQYSLSIGHVLNSQFLPFVRMLINGIFRTEVINLPSESGMGFQNVSQFGDGSNVVNFFAYIYYIKYHILWGFIITGFGFISELLYNRMRRVINVESLLIGIVYFSFSFLSFFASYFSLSTPWELMFWAIIIPSLLRYLQRNKVM